MCVCVCVGWFIIYNEHSRSRERGSTTGAEALDTNYATRKKNKQKNRCFFLLPFDQSYVVFTEQNNYPKGISMRHMNDVWNLPAL